MTPLTIRNKAATDGLASATRTGCSSASPRIPTGMHASTISHANRSVEVSTLRVTSVRKKPRTIRTQSRQK